jgi:hypothetical protein
MCLVPLTVSYFAGAGGNGQTVTFQEFNTQEACFFALKVLEEKKKPGHSWDNYKLTCVQKG